MSKIINKFFYFNFLFLFLIPTFSLASQTVGTISSTAYGAWGSNIGWVNFAPTNGGLTITDSSVTGSVWSPQYGWINFTPTNGGVANDGNGKLSGSAWGDNLGWIDFSGVTINANGRFTGSATGTILGTLTFDCDNCDVETDWRPASVRNTQQGGQTLSSGGSDGGFSYPIVLGTTTLPANSSIASSTVLTLPVHTTVPVYIVQTKSALHPYVQGTATASSLSTMTSTSSVIFSSTSQAVKTALQIQTTSKNNSSSIISIIKRPVVSYTFTFLILFILLALFVRI